MLDKKEKKSSCLRSTLISKWSYAIVALPFGKMIR